MVKLVSNYKTDVFLVVVFVSKSVVFQITVTIVAVAVCLVESAEQCTEEFLTAMVDTVCALNKRSFSHNSPIIWSALQQNLNNMELRYKEMMTGTDQVEELLLGDILLKRKPKGIYNGYYLCTQLNK